MLDDVLNILQILCFKISQLFSEVGAIITSVLQMMELRQRVK